MLLETGAESASGVFQTDEVETLKDRSAVSVKKFLVQKHSSGQSADDSILISGDQPRAIRVKKNQE